MTKNTNFSIFPACPDDISVLVDHHKRMFKEILLSQGSDSHIPDWEDLDNAYKNKLNSELGHECNAWIMKTSDNKTVASGAVSIISMVPVPNENSCNVAFLHSVFTENEYRNKGFAGRILKEIINYCKDQGIKRIFLNASNDGMPLYKKIGFESVDNYMRLWLE
ncbi:MAG: GNAT family N-acetyltransferase [Desulfobacteraceae bacterium]|jgi:N-acetylglutamate synthase-like GNAT family acetyltransferase